MRGWGRRRGAYVWGDIYWTIIINKITRTERRRCPANRAFVSSLSGFF